MARPRKFDDDAVLLRATDLFWKRGVDAVSIRDLEVSLELRAPSIYRRFHSKEELLVRCLDRYVEQEVGGRIRRYLGDVDDQIVGLRNFFTSALRPHRGEQRLRGCFLTTTAAHTKAGGPGVQASVDRGFALIEEAFRRQIERAKQTGHVGPAADAAATAKALLLSFQGLLVLARSGAPDLEAGIDATFRAHFGATIVPDVR